MIRLGALAHTITVLELAADGTESTGGTFRARVDPLDGAEHLGGLLVDEATYLVILEPAANGQIAAHDAFVWDQRSQRLEAVGPALPLYDHGGVLHHLELSARLEPGFGETVTVYRDAVLGDGTVDADGVFSPGVADVVYAGVARVRRSDAAGSATSQGESLQVETTWRLELPWRADGTAEVRAFDRVVVDETIDDALDGRTFRVVTTGPASPQSGRAFPLDAVDIDR